MIKYYNTGQTIGLYNEGYVSQSEYYSSAKNNADYKVIRNIDMGALLKQLSDFGYFDKASPGIVRAGGASLTLLVQRGTDAWTVHLPRYVGRTDDEKAKAAYKKEMEFAYKCADAVRAIYNTTRSLQLIENEMGAEFFDKKLSASATRTRARQRIAGRERGHGRRRAREDGRDPAAAEAPAGGKRPPAAGSHFGADASRPSGPGGCSPPSMTPNSLKSLVRPARRRC